MAQTRPQSRHSLPDLFDKALAYAGGTHTRADVWEGIKTGRYIYVGDDRACSVLEVVQYPRCRKLHVFLAAGDFEHMMETHRPRWIELAKEHGCASITNVSRKGFVRRLPKYGFTPKSVAFEMELANV